MSTQYNYTSIQSIIIDWGDGSVSTDLSGFHIYSSPGIYSGTITVTDSESGVTVSNFPVNVGYPDDFQSVLIDWGDGTTSDTLSGVKIFERPGNFIVTVSGLDSEGNSAISYNYIQIGGEDVGYYLDFGDGSYTTQPNTSHTYTTPGIYDYYLYESGLGGPLLDSGTITVEAPPSGVDYSGIVHLIYFNACHPSIEIISPFVIYNAIATGGRSKKPNVNRIIREINRNTNNLVFSETDYLRDQQQAPTVKEPVKHDGKTLYFKLKEVGTPPPKLDPPPPPTPIEEPPKKLALTRKKPVHKIRIKNRPIERAD